MVRASLLLCAVPIVIAGCAVRGPVNPSFPLSMDEAEAAFDEMAGRPLSLERPLVIAGGFLDPGLGPWWAGRRLRRAFDDDGRILTVSFFTCCRFDSARTRLIDAVDAAFPSDDPLWTAEVDVVGISMGGVVARLAAAPPEPGSSSRRRLRIARLFTVSSPHRGANLAGMPLLHPLQPGMLHGSELLEALDRVRRDGEYELVPYVRLEDWLVGTRNAAPPGETPWWVSNGPLHLAHVAGCIDARIYADIARRLRGEPHYTRKPIAPLPD